jgi:hypothetical protein
MPNRVKALTLPPECGHSKMGYNPKESPNGHRNTSAIHSPN